MREREKERESERESEREKESEGESEGERQAKLLSADSHVIISWNLTVLIPLLWFFHRSLLIDSVLD